MPIEVRSLAEWEAAGIPGMLSVVIPAHDEEGHIDFLETQLDLVARLGLELYAQHHIGEPDGD